VATPPVLLIHGAGGGAWEWNVWRRVCTAAGHEVITPTLEPTARGLEATTLDDYLVQLRAVWPERPPLLLGASLGGLLALALAAERECAALVLINPLPPSPEAAQLPWVPPPPARIAWGRDANLAGTRRSMPDADDAACAYAARRWRDESGQVLAQARAGLELSPPRCPALLLGSVSDDDVPVELTAALAARLSASFWRLSGSHVGPLLGRQAAALAKACLDWSQASVRFTTD
jgi:pimeloyl-ACP methyl ester carboxylesterase